MGAGSWGNIGATNGAFIAGMSSRKYSGSGGSTQEPEDNGYIFIWIALFLTILIGVYVLLF